MESSFIISGMTVLIDHNIEGQAALEAKNIAVVVLKNCWKLLLIWIIILEQDEYLFPDLILNFPKIRFLRNSRYESERDDCQITVLRFPNPDRFFAQDFHKSHDVLGQ